MFDIIEANETMMFSPYYGNADIPVIVIRKVTQSGIIVGMQALDMDGYEIVGSAERFHK